MKTIFKRMLAGESIPIDDPQRADLAEACNEAKKLTVALNNETDAERIREILSQITAQPLDETSTVFTPFFTNNGKNIRIGKGVFINHACSMLDWAALRLRMTFLLHRA